MMYEKTRNFQGEEPTYKKGGTTMKTKMKILMKNQKGMTLIELLAVIVIIAIIALIAIPAISTIIQNSKDKAVLSDASQIISSAKIAIADGVCDGGATNVCDKAALASYVDLEKDYTHYTVTKDGTGKFSISFSGFAEIKNSTKFPSTANKGATTDVVTAANLASDMGKK